MPAPPAENAIEEVKMEPQSAPRVSFAAERDESTPAARPNPVTSALWAPPSRGFNRPIPGSEEYYAEKLPGFPPYVHEAFAAKARGEEAFQEFLEGTARPGILSRVGEEDAATGEIATKDVVVNWF
jgi:hypothetical protein